MLKEIELEVDGTNIKDSTKVYDLFKNLNHEMSMAYDHRHRIPGFRIYNLPNKYIINENATILFWEDGTKTIVKRAEEDVHDIAKSFLWAYFQKYCGMSKTQANKYLAHIVEENIKEVE